MRNLHRLSSCSVYSIGGDSAIMADDVAELGNSMMVQHYENRFQNLRKQMLMQAKRIKAW